MENKCNEDRYKKGMNILKKIKKDVIRRLFDELEDIVSNLGRFVVEFFYSEIYTKKSLNLKTKELFTVVILTVMGNAEPQLKDHINLFLM